MTQFHLHKRALQLYYKYHQNPESLLNPSTISLTIMPQNSRLKLLIRFMKVGGDFLFFASFSFFSSSESNKDKEEIECLFRGRKTEKTVLNKIFHWGVR